MVNTLKRLLLVARPISWPNTAYPFAAGYLVAGGQVDWLFIVGSLYFVIPYNLLMYGVNDVFDYESDIRNPRKGGIEGMREQRKFHPVIVRAALASQVIFLPVLFLLGTFAANIALLVLLFFVVAYSVAYLRFKERPILDSITSSVHFVGPLIYALVLIGFTSEASPYVISFFLWGMASHAFGAVQDILPDREAGLSSIATFLGTKYTTLLSLVLYIAASIIVLLQPLPYALIGIAGLGYVINIVPAVRLNDADSQLANKPWRRFIWLNLMAGFLITLILLLQVVNGR